MLLLRFSKPTKYVTFSIALMLGLFAVIYFCGSKIEKDTEKFVFSDVNEIPACYVGLVLGTSPVVKSGRDNLYFTYRIEAAASLYHSGKVKRLLVSGDNGTRDYNEPTAMRDSLIAKGVQAEHIYLDYAGFRTFDSVIRANKIFGQTSFIVVSQRFHNERAVYIARGKGLNAWGLNAKEVNPRYSIKTRFREKLARVNVFWDLLIGTEPKYYGPSVKLL